MTILQNFEHVDFLAPLHSPFFLLPIKMSVYGPGEGCLLYIFDNHFMYFLHSDPYPPEKNKKTKSKNKSSSQQEHQQYQGL